MAKNIKNIMMDKGEFKKEHHRLVKALKSKSRKDDKYELKMQRKEMREVLGG